MSGLGEPDGWDRTLDRLEKVVSLVIVIAVVAIIVGAVVIAFRSFGLAAPVVVFLALCAVGWAFSPLVAREVRAAGRDSKGRSMGGEAS